MINSIKKNESINLKTMDFINFNINDCNYNKLENEDLQILNKVKNYFKQYENGTKDDNLYIKLNRGTNNDLRVIYFNITKFIEENKGKIIFFTGSKESISDDLTYMEIKYMDNKNSANISHILKGTELYKTNYIGGYLYICEFISYDPKKGNGKFLLNYLMDIVQKINNEIINSILKGIQKDPISVIFGLVRPDKTVITKENLVKLYRDNGFIILSKIYDCEEKIEDEIIYKKLRIRKYKYFGKLLNVLLIKYKNIYFKKYKKFI